MVTAPMRSSLRPEPDEAADERAELRGQIIRWAVAFSLIFAAVFFAFWWSGSALRFSAARVIDAAAPTWQVQGSVRDAATGQPVPWAEVQDDPGGRPPFYSTQADQHGHFTLLTLAERHKLRVTAPGYRAASVTVGRMWFIWMPKGAQLEDICLTAE